MTPVRSVTGATPGIGIDPSGDGDEFPVIAGRVQAQLQNTEGAVVARLRIGWSWAVERGEVGSTRADHELANPSLRVRSAGGIERHVPLVIMIMPGEEHLHPMVIERLP